MNELLIGLELTPAGVIIAGVLYPRRPRRRMIVRGWVVDGTTVKSRGTIRQRRRLPFWLYNLLERLLGTDRVVRGDEVHNFTCYNCDLAVKLAGTENARIRGGKYYGYYGPPQVQGVSPYA